MEATTASTLCTKGLRVDDMWVRRHKAMQHPEDVKTYSPQPPIRRSPVPFAASCACLPLLVPGWCQPGNAGWRPLRVRGREGQEIGCGGVSMCPKSPADAARFPRLTQLCSCFILT